MANVMVGGAMVLVDGVGGGGWRWLSRQGSVGAMIGLSGGSQTWWLAVRIVVVIGVGGDGWAGGWPAGRVIVMRSGWQG